MLSIAAIEKKLTALLRYYRRSRRKSQRKKMEKIKKRIPIKKPPIKKVGKQTKKGITEARRIQSRSQVREKPKRKVRKIKRPPLPTPPLKKGTEKRETGRATIETRPDRLYRMVTSQGKVTVQDAAKIFGVEEKVIEGWGNILEEHKLLKLHYPAFGKVILSKLEVKEKPKPPPEKTRGKRRGRGKKLFTLGLLVLLGFVLLWRLPSFQLPSLQPLSSQFPSLPGGDYLLLGILVIIVMLLLFAIRRERRKGRGHGKR